MRQLAADGVRVVGRVLGASGGTVAIDANANQILDEADAAFAEFLAAARALATQRIREELNAEEAVDPTRLPAADEVGSLDLARQNISTIIWATGYAYNFGWLNVPVFDERGRPVQQRGITQSPGLYFLGLHWCRRRVKTDPADG